MCGRISLGSSSTALSAYFGLTDFPSLAPRYNIAPGQPIVGIRLSAAKKNEAALLHWGLIPAWAKDKNIGYKMINARAESAAEKPSFRSAFKSRRCLIPADGFYEWQRKAKDKQPYHIRQSGQDLFTFAGLWETWIDKESGELLESCTILTTAANSLLQPIHHRMPVIIPKQSHQQWLTAETTSLDKLLQPQEWPDFEAVPVSNYVNIARNEGVECIQRVDL